MNGHPQTSDKTDDNSASNRPTLGPDDGGVIQNARFSQYLLGEIADMDDVMWNPLSQALNDGSAASGEHPLYYMATVGNFID